MTLEVCTKTPIFTKKEEYFESVILEAPSVFPGGAACDRD